MLAHLLLASAFVAADAEPRAVDFPGLVALTVANGPESAVAAAERDGAGIA